VAGAESNGIEIVQDKAECYLLLSAFNPEYLRYPCYQLLIIKCLKMESASKEFKG